MGLLSLQILPNNYTYPGSYQQRILYRLTSMGAQKNNPKKQNVKLLGLTCMFVKRKFDETHKDFSINYSYNVEKRFTVLTFFSTKLRNTLVPNSLDKLMQLVSLEHHIYDLDRDKITDLDKFLKKPHSIVLS